jgi:hypothetical protein
LEEVRRIASHATAACPEGDSASAGEEAEAP